MSFRSDRRGWAVAPALLALLLLLGAWPIAGMAPSASVPIGDDGRFITNLSAPVLAPGDHGYLSMDVSNPLASPLTPLLMWAVYAFNAYPGNATGPLPVAAPTPAGQFATAGDGPQGLPGNLTYVDGDFATFGTLAPGQTVPYQDEVVTSASTPSGDYAVRISLQWNDPNGSPVVLESRGFFSNVTWAAATHGPNGTPTLNLTVLGVDGVLPETAILVRANPFPWILYPILGGALILAAAGGYYAFRRRGSRSGAIGPDEPSHAPRAFGKRRRSDGD
jgi:hypothetical protein